LSLKRIRITGLDAAIALAVLVALGYGIYRIQVQLHYQWNWGALPQFICRYDGGVQRWVPNYLLKGLITTVKLSLWATILALLAGTLAGMAQVSRRLFSRLLGRTYVEMVRNLPPLVLIFIFYYFLSDQIMPWLGFNVLLDCCGPAPRTILSLLFAPADQFASFASALVTLAVFEGAYIAEIVRAGIESIEKGQWEASAALGFSRAQRMRHILLPQAVRRILPPLGGQFISTIKDSAIVSVISIQELTFQAMDLMASTFLNFEIWITVAAIYLALTLPCSLAVARLEVVFNRHHRRGS
jgi:polar amino acid transport system permease protein